MLPWYRLIVVSTGLRIIYNIQYWRQVSELDCIALSNMYVSQQTKSTDCTLLPDLTNKRTVHFSVKSILKHLFSIISLTLSVFHESVSFASSIFMLSYYRMINCCFFILSNFRRNKSMCNDCKQFHIFTTCRYATTLSLKKFYSKHTRQLYLEMMNLSTRMFYVLKDT